MDGWTFPAIIDSIDEVKVNSPTMQPFLERVATLSVLSQCLGFRVKAIPNHKAMRPREGGRAREDG